MSSFCYLDHNIQIWKWDLHILCDLSFGIEAQPNCWIKKFPDSAFVNINDTPNAPQLKLLCWPLANWNLDTAAESGVLHKETEGYDSPGVVLQKVKKFKLLHPISPLPDPHTFLRPKIPQINNVVNLCPKTVKLLNMQSSTNLPTRFCISNFDSNLITFLSSKYYTIFTGDWTSLPQG